MNWKRFTALMAVLLFLGVSSMAMAETHSRFITGFPVYEPRDGESYIISNTLDFSDLKTQGAGTAGQLSGVSKEDTVKLLLIPAGTVVERVGARIYTAWSTPGTTCWGVGIGDASNVTGWISRMDWGPSATGVSVSFAGVTPVWSGTEIAYSNSGDKGVNENSKYGTGKYYSTATPLVATMPKGFGPGILSSASGLTDFVMQIWAECVKPRTQKAYKRTGN